MHELTELFLNSPTGKLIQLEYALNAVQAGTTSIGIKGMSVCCVSIIALNGIVESQTRDCNVRPGTNGAVVVTEKKMASILVDDSTVHKVDTLDVIKQWLHAHSSHAPYDIDSGYANYVRHRSRIQWYRTRQPVRMGIL